jgi:hypothetical protein
MRAGTDAGGATQGPGLPRTRRSGFPSVLSEIQELSLGHRRSSWEKPAIPGVEPGARTARSVIS